jgi:hypothetical protein
MHQFTFIGNYKKSIDEIDQQKSELWQIFDNSKTTPTRKIKIIRELHKLTITSTLLLRNLPFVPLFLTTLIIYQNKKSND